MFLLFQEEFSFIHNSQNRESVFRSVKKRSLLEINENIEKIEEQDITTNEITKRKFDTNKNSLKNSLLSSLNPKFSILNKTVRIYF